MGYLNKSLSVHDIQKMTKGIGVSKVYSLCGDLMGHRKDPLEGIDIDKEYELIQQKRSTLSASLRKLVINRKKG